jgi:hypothetical protein
MGDSMTSESLVESLQGELFGRSTTDQEIRRRVLSDKGLSIGTPSGVVRNEFMRAEASAQLFAGYGTQGARDLNQALMGIAGKGGMSPKMARAEFTRAQKNINAMGEASLDGVEEQNKLAALKAIDSMGISNRSLDKMMDSTMGIGMTKGQILLLARNQKHAAYKRYSKGIKAVTKDMTPAKDEDGNFLNLFDRVVEGQGSKMPKGDREALKAILDKKGDVSDEEIKRLTKGKFETKGEWDKHYGKQIKDAEKGLKAQLEFKGELLQSRLEDPNLQIDVAGEALKFSDMREEELQKQIGKMEGGEDFLGITETQQKKLAGVLKGGLGAFGKALGEMTGRAGQSSKSIAAMASFVGKKQGVDLMSIKTQFSHKGRELSLGQLQQAKEAGAFDTGKKMQENSNKSTNALEKLVQLMEQVAGATVETSKLTAEEARKKGRAGAVDPPKTSKSGPGK